MQHGTEQNQSWLRSYSHKGPDKGHKQKMTQFWDKLFKVGEE